MALHSHSIGAVTLAITVAASATTSSAFANKGAVALGLVMPHVFTGTTLTFLVSTDGVTFHQLYDTSNTAVSLTVAIDRNYQLPAALATWPYFKIVSGSSELADRALVVVAQT